MSTLSILTLVGVFGEGILSFFSPCVLPLLPLYIGYFSGMGEVENEKKHRSKILINTLFFVLGISVVFLLLALSFTALGQFFKAHQGYFVRIGGIIIILLGLLQIGFVSSRFLSRDFRIPFNVNKFKMSPFVAFLMGMAFSFGWTPCVGPALASILVLISGTKSVAMGVAIIAIYALGFLLPFLFLGFFTDKALEWLNNHKKVMDYTVKIGGAILIIIGFSVFFGYAGVSQYLSEPSAVVSESAGENSADKNASGQEAQIAPTIVLQDQNGKKVSLEDFKGKTVFLNFWASWCGPCQKEMPHIEELYHEYGENKKDVAFVTVTNANGKNDLSPDEMKDFVKEHGFSFPVLLDENGETFASYYIRSYPTTFLINKDGKIYGYVNGSLTKEIMKKIITETQNSTK